MGRSWLLGAAFLAFVPMAQAEESEARSEVSVLKRTAVPSLSPKALEALVAGVAFYPDSLIEQIFDAAQDPSAVHEAAQRLPGNYRPSIVLLTNYPDVLNQLDQHLALTARLGLAAKHQLVDVWAAIDRVRSQFEESNPKSTEAAATEAPSAISSTTAVPVPVVRPYGAFVTGLLVEDVLDELQSSYTYSTVTAATTGGAVAGTTTVGDTTHLGAAGAGTIETANGNSYGAAGGLHGTVTSTENGTSVTKQSAGAVVNTSTGGYAAGARSTTATVQYNSDGSTSFSRNAATQTQSSVGSSNIQHQGNLTVGADGSKSFAGSTEIQSTHGDANISTSASDGVVTTTVDSARGENTFTAGDGQIQNAPASTARYSDEQLQAGAAAMNQSWGQLDQHTAGRKTQEQQRATGNQRSFNRPGSSGSAGAVNFQPNHGGRQAPSRSAPSRGGRRR